MKLQLDTENKIIRIEESVNLDEFYTMIKKLFPNDLWKKFKLETNVISNWTSPIIIKEYPVYPYPYTPQPIYIQPSPSLPDTHPFTQPNYQPYPWITCGTSNLENTFGDKTTSWNLNSGVYNIECQPQA
jgi:hypothetical protein